MGEDPEGGGFVWGGGYWWEVDLEGGGPEDVWEVEVNGVRALGLVVHGWLERRRVLVQTNGMWVAFVRVDRITARWRWLAERLLATQPRDPTKWEAYRLIAAVHRAHRGYRAPRQPRQLPSSSSTA